MSDKPNPRINEINRPFWEGCNEGRLRLQQCTASGCGLFLYFPRVCCPYCQNGDLEWAEPSGRGRIVSYSLIHRPQHESFFAEAPYYLLAVELAEGPLIYSRLDGDPGSEERLLGHAVEVVFVDHTAEQRLPFFRLVDDA